MQGKTVVITGATSGIGAVAAETLARQGARIVFIARDSARADKTLAQLKTAGPMQAHRSYLADLSTLAEMKRVGAAIAAAEPNIDVLMNNAGALFNKRQETADGLEMTFAVNHMAYFVLTEALLPSLKTTPGARIVSTASAAHFGARLDFDDLQARKNYAGFAVYGRSKLCNILFTPELAKRLAGSGVTANCHHPGFVATRFAMNNGPLAMTAMLAAKAVARTPEQGAATMIYLATSSEVAASNGLYFDRCKATTPSPAAQDDRAAARLWEESARLAAAR